MSLSSLSRRHAFWVFVAYLLFVVYGSLLPFEYRDLSLDQAIGHFIDISYLDLGIGSRADWVANIVLYLPLAFLCCTWILGMRTVSAHQLLALLLVFAICLTVAVAVEFSQIFFSPRTVSLNDLLAETLGTLGGISLWILGRWRIARLWDAFSEGGRQSVLAAITVYGLVYIALSLFPYDFVVSTQEFAWKLASKNQGWLIAGDCSDWLRCGAHMGGEIVAIAPLGLLIHLAFPRLNLVRLITGGLIFGLLLETLQLSLISGISQGFSVILRSIGLTVGALTGAILQRKGPVTVARLIWLATPFLAFPYLLILAALGGWFSGSWLSLDEALLRLKDVRIMPFYHHYFSTEPVAMASLLANATMYAPVGLALWARKTAGMPMLRRGTLIAALWAIVLALPIELGKLLVASKHPDLTNLLIAAASAAFIYALASWVEHVLVGGVPRVPAQRMTSDTARPARSTIDWQTPHPAGLVLGIPAGLTTLFGLAYYPEAMPLLGVLLLAYGMLLWRWPLFWFFLLPALLPLLDLSPFTGRLMLDEFDLFVLTTLAVGYVRVYRIKPLPWSHPLLPVTVVLLWVTWVIATAKGLWPLTGVEGEIPVSSHSPMETWHVGKGLLWALLLIPIIRRVPRDAVPRALDHTLTGLIIGLAGVSLAVMWERHIYVGLLDFENVFRVTGTLASMHTGGAYIEAFIAFAFPVLAVWILTQRSLSLQLLGSVVAALSIYAMLVTFSRGGYAGLVAGLLVVALGVYRLRSDSATRRWMSLAGIVMVVIVIAVPVLSGGFAQQRLSQVSEDLSFRQAHWGRALDLMDNGLTAMVTGTGFGQYPLRYLLYADYQKPPGTYAVVRDNDDQGQYLRLGAGETVFLDQLVAVEPGNQYRLTTRLRTQYGAGSLRIYLCEKALLYSFGCVWQQLEPGPSASGWHGLTIDIDSGELGSAGRWPYRPVKLSLHNPGGEIIDVDDVSLTTSEGVELLKNGDFSDAIEHWLFVTDQDLAWHIHQQWVEMYFAQGLLGVTAFVVLLIAIIAILRPAIRDGNPQATAFAAALVAFLTVGLLGSTMDTARLSMLFYFCAICAGLLTQSENTGHTGNNTQWLREKNVL